MQNDTIRSPSTWIFEKIRGMTSYHPRVWVEDPYCLLDDSGEQSLESYLKPLGFELVIAANAFTLRERLLRFECESAKLVVIDQSMNPREPHLLPQDCKPGDFKALRAPDWKPFLSDEAIFRPTIRDFLVFMTSSTSWPEEVNVYPFEELARTRTEAFLKAYQKYLGQGVAIGTSELLLIGASCVLDTDVSDLINPIEALDVRFHRKQKWAELERLFNREELESINKSLCTLPSPIGDLFSENADRARIALTSLIILRQHFYEPGKVLPILSPDLTKYQECTTELCTEAPFFFTKEEVPRFERLLKKDARTYISNQLGLEKEDAAKEFHRNERFSKAMRELAAFEAPFETTLLRVSEPQGPTFSVGDLTKRFMQAKRQLSVIISEARSQVEKIRLTPLAEQNIEQFHKAFVVDGLHLLDYSAGLIDSCIQDIEGPARKQWSDIRGYEARWQTESAEARDLVTKARKLQDDADNLFGRLLEKRYDDFVPGKVVTSDTAYQDFMAPRRRKGAGKIHRAAILLMDGMRFDWWRQLIRPYLEGRYIIEESYALARLPSETRIARRAFFSGKQPGMLPNGPETKAFSELLTRVHGKQIQLAQIEARTGMSFAAETADKSTFAGVFDFADSFPHDINWPPHKVMSALHNMPSEIEAVFEERPDDAVFFMTADHGHIMSHGGAVYLDGLTQVGYRSAESPSRIASPNAERVFQIESKRLGHTDSGWHIFPRPGYYLRPGDGDHGRPKKGYRHGGISLYEMMVPLVAIRPRSMFIQVKMDLALPRALVQDETSEILISIRAESEIAFPIRLVADWDDAVTVTIPRLSTTVQSVSMPITPSKEGMRRILISAYLEGEAGNALGRAEIDVDIKPAKAPVDVAAAKLKKLFGDL